MDTIRILVAVDVKADDLRAVYGANVSRLFVPDSAEANDLDATFKARLDEFYPGVDGYATPDSVVAVAVDRNVPVLDGVALRGLYEVGVEGVDQ